MKKEKTIGFFLIAGAIGDFIRYTILTMIFEYPDILRHDPGTNLTKFHKGGSSLIITWLAFAILGLPLLIAIVEAISFAEKYLESIGIITITKAAVILHKLFLSFLFY